MLGIEVAVEVGQLDGVGDGFDLLVEPTDVGISDVGHLFEHQLFDLGPGQLLDQQPGPSLHQKSVTGPELHVPHGVGQLGHPLLVGAGEDDGPSPSVEHLLQHHHLAGSLALAGEDHAEGLVEHDLVAAFEVVKVDVRMERHSHLAPAGENVDGAVVVGTEVGAIGGRRLRELLDLFAQVGHMFLGRLQSEGELLVLGDGLSQLAFGLEELLLEGLDPARALLQPTPEEGYLLFRGRDPQQQGLDVVLVAGACSPAAASRLVEVNRGHHLTYEGLRPLRPTLHRYSERTTTIELSISPGRAVASERPASPTEVRSASLLLVPGTISARSRSECPAAGHCARRRT